MELLSIKEASIWASEYLKKNVTTSNISYLVQYGRIPKIGENGSTRVSKQDLIDYYATIDSSKKEIKLKEKLGKDLNWELSFSEYKEADTTKHVHRLHPYKGKFIPQLVEYFLDSHTDKLKKKVFFKRGDIVLDPFCGSGTTLVQANELGINAIGVDVSIFNTLISNSKIEHYDLFNILETAESISSRLKTYLSEKKYVEFEEELTQELKKFNDKYFPSSTYKRKLNLKEIDEKSYSEKYKKKFQPQYNKLVKKYKIQLLQKGKTSFLEKWYLDVIRKEIDFIWSLIQKVENPKTKHILSIILSRTIRSCRATTHSDLATLLEPVSKPYYCKKHGKICKPLFSVVGWWERYVKDTVKRLDEFNKLRTDTQQICLTGDSRTINIAEELKERKIKLGNKKINGIFSSPPYVGVIDYHEQHAYSYDLFDLERKDELEIGALYNGQGNEAKESYVQGIAAVLNNCKKYMNKNCNVFLVANDKYNLYPRIAELAGMKIVNQYKRPVLNRVEDGGAYAEIIFHMKNK